MLEQQNVMGFLNVLYYLTVRKSLAQENSIMRKNYESLAFLLPVIKFSFWDKHINI